MSTLSRRSFLEAGTLAGTLAATTGLHSRTASAATIRHRTLGSTGKQVSEVGFGVMNNRDPELVRAAIDAGINYLDTANSYMNGVNEEIIGEVMRTERDKVFLTTKLKASGGASQLQSMLEASLKRLRTDHVDCVLLHGVSNANDFMNQEIMDAYGAFRDKGLAKFIGVSTHTNMAVVIDTVAERGFWNLVCTSYNFSSPPELTESIVRARKAGIAMVAMKTQNRGGYTAGATDTVTAQQAALKWVLANESIDTTIPGMTSFEHLAENLPVMEMKLSSADRRELNRMAHDLKGNYCYGVAGCTGCLDKCPNGVAMNEINRCLGYAYGYGDIRLAHENYDALPAGSRLDACSDCSECQVKCVNGLNLTNNIHRARSLFV